MFYVQSSIDVITRLADRRMPVDRVIQSSIPAERKAQRRSPSAEAIGSTIFSISSNIISCSKNTGCSGARPGADRNPTFLK
ncbi:MAG: hypothetical protein WC373_04015, partial [Smithella sp.]